MSDSLLAMLQNDCFWNGFALGMLYACVLTAYAMWPKGTRDE